MFIKGFDKDLKCRGFQFEIGGIYETGARNDELKLCSNTVFHFCRSLEQVHQFYDCSNKGNRFCEIEVLGTLIEDSDKCGSNKIKIVREITDSELNVLKGTVYGNVGLFNTGSRNTGYSNAGNNNTGDYNFGYFNTGSSNLGHHNSGHCNTGDRNVGNRNTGNENSGDYNAGHYNSGDYNTGSRNAGFFNTGYKNTGCSNTGNHNTGDKNTGNFNTGNFNTGHHNVGMFNSCGYSNGFFNTKEPTINIFNIDSGMTMSEFMKSEYYYALSSTPFILTRWIKYTEEEKKTDKEKELVGGYLKEYTFYEACQNWWNRMSDKNKEIIKSIPNFDAEIFKEITGIEVLE